MDHRLTPEQQNATIESALHSRPLAPMPHDITASVMSRIQQAPAPRSFHVTWSDFAIALAISLCIGAVWFSLLYLPPLALIHVHVQSILFYQDLFVNAHHPIPAILFGLAALLSALTIPYLRNELSTSNSR